MMRCSKGLGDARLRIAALVALSDLFEERRGCRRACLAQGHCKARRAGWRTLLAQMVAQARTLNVLPLQFPKEAF
jgi:hypothetical protein